MNMPEYRRVFIPGGAYFFTLVTYNRLPILTSEDARRLLHTAMTRVGQRFPYQTIAICLLPDHLHCLWTLPEGDANYPLRWNQIKRLFSIEYRKSIGPVETRNPSRIKHREAAIWQRRYWEHTIRDEQDLHNHIDYIHYNPVKHGLVERAADWPWSSFHRYVREGLCAPDLGEGMARTLNKMNCGE